MKVVTITESPIKNNSRFLGNMGARNKDGVLLGCALMTNYLNWKRQIATCH